MSEVKVSLGRHVFYDRLPSDDIIACASCHHQSLALSEAALRGQTLFFS